MTIINDDSRVIYQLEASLTDYDRIVIYDHHMFIVQATGQTGFTQVDLEPPKGILSVCSLLAMKSLKRQFYVLLLP